MRGERGGDVSAVAAGDDLGQVGKVGAAHAGLQGVMPDQELRMADFREYFCTGQDVMLKIIFYGLLRFFVAFLFHGICMECFKF